MIYCASCGHPHRVALGCKDRTCPECRLKFFGYHFEVLVALVKGWRAVYFLTLTLKNIPDEAFGRHDVKRLRACFGKLRRRFPQIADGFYAVQTTSKGRGWHLHLHTLFDGRYVPKAELSKAWLEITGDSFMVDIRKVEDPKKAVRYLLSDFLQSPRIRPEDYKSFNGVFAGSRIIQAFGRCRKDQLRRPFKCPKCGCDSWITDLDELFDPLESKRPAHRYYESDG
jgi:hypothetical protein